MILQKQLYGLLQSALLLYLKLVTGLKINGFVINPYIPCVEKQIVISEVITVVQHIDDLKVSHKDPFEVTKFAQYLSIIYGEKIKVHMVKVHDYLCMDSYYSEPVVVEVSMIKYLQKVLYYFPEESIRTLATPEAVHMFRVRT